jgi:DNA mismatch repair protein MutS
MMRQYFELKPQDAVLFFRMGDFYEVFGDDALEVAPKLDLQLANRSDPNKIPFCGVPHHAIEQYLQKLLRLGYKIAIAEQVEDPKEAKGLVKREILRTLTPGAQMDIEGEANYLMGVFEHPKTRQFEVALADISSGDLRLGQLSTKEEVLALAHTFNPKEILLRQFIIKDFFPAVPKGVRLSAFCESTLREDSELLAEMKLRFSHPCSQVLAGVMGYFHQLKLGTDHFYGVRELYEKDYFNLHSTTLRDLEIFSTLMHGEKEGSLVHEINRTLTPMGRQALVDYLLRPLKNAEALKSRLDQVEEYSQKLEIRNDLGRVADLRRIRAKIINSSIKAADFMRLLLSLEAVQHIASKLKDLDFTPILPLLDKLQSALNQVSEGSASRFFRHGYCESLDSLYDLSENGEKAVTEYENALKQQTGIPSLKIKTHHSYGLLVEVTKVHLEKIPASFVRKQTMVSAERFLTEDLIELHQRLSEAEAAARQREADLYAALIEYTKQFQSHLWDLAQAVAEIDVLSSFAQLAKERRLIRPKISEKIAIKASRHLVVETAVGMHRFVPNDICIDQDNNTALITGPNMAGKSTFMRQLAQAALLHQIGSYVPATYAELPLFDGIYTRLGAYDDLSSGQSTFLVEMNEASVILRNATQSSLVIVDEIGRGTSTQDGLALAEAILRDLHDRIRCFCLFSTHYHELIPRVDDLQRMQLLHAGVERQEDGSVYFSRKLSPGVCSSSYGIEVAKMAGLPKHVIETACAFLQESAQNTPPDMPKTCPPINSQGDWQGLEKLKTLNINRLTPLQAIKILDELQSSVLHPKHQGELFVESES